MPQSNDDFIMLHDSLGQDFGYGSVGMASLCSLMSEASAEECGNDWGRLERLGVQIACTLFMHGFGTQAGLT